MEKATLPTVLKPGAVVALGGGVTIDDDNWRLVSTEATTVYLEVPFTTIWASGNVGRLVSAAFGAAVAFLRAGDWLKPGTARRRTSK